MPAPVFKPQFEKVFGLCGGPRTPAARARLAGAHRCLGSLPSSPTHTILMTPTAHTIHMTPTAHTTHMTPTAHTTHMTPTAHTTHMTPTATSTCYVPHMPGCGTIRRYACQARALPRACRASRPRFLTLAGVLDRQAPRCACSPVARPCAPKPYCVPAARAVAAVPTWVPLNPTACPRRARWLPRWLPPPPGCPPQNPHRSCPPFSSMPCRRAPALAAGSVPGVGAGAAHLGRKECSRREKRARLPSTMELG
jgi:hypothetical protein